MLGSVIEPRDGSALRAFQKKLKPAEPA